MCVFVFIPSYLYIYFLLVLHLILFTLVRVLNNFLLSFHPVRFLKRIFVKYKDTRFMEYKLKLKIKSGD